MEDRSKYYERLRRHDNSLASDLSKEAALPLAAAFGAVARKVATFAGKKLTGGMKKSKSAVSTGFKNVAKQAPKMQVASSVIKAVTPNANVPISKPAAPPNATTPGPTA